MNGLAPVNGLHKMNQEPQENTLCNEKLNTTGAGFSGVTTGQEKMMGGYRIPEEIAIAGSVSGNAAIPGAWGK